MRVCWVCRVCRLSVQSLQDLLIDWTWEQKRVLRDASKVSIRTPKVSNGTIQRRRLPFTHLPNLTSSVIRDRGLDGWTARCCQGLSWRGRVWVLCIFVSLRIFYFWKPPLCCYFILGLLGTARVNSVSEVKTLPTWLDSGLADTYCITNNAQILN